MQARRAASPLELGLTCSTADRRRCESPGLTGPSRTRTCRPAAAPAPRAERARACTTVQPGAIPARCGRESARITGPAIADPPIFDEPHGCPGRRQPQRRPDPRPAVHYREDPRRPIAQPIVQSRLPALPPTRTSTDPCSARGRVKLDAQPAAAPQREPEEAPAAKAQGKASRGGFEAREDLDQFSAAVYSRA